MKNPTSRLLTVLFVVITVLGVAWFSRALLHWNTAPTLVDPNRTLVMYTQGNQNIRNIDFSALLIKEYERLCRENGFTEEYGFIEHKDWEPIAASSTRITYADITGDGNEEVLVNAWSCMAGNSGPDISRVYTLSASSSTAELVVDESVRFNGKNYSLTNTVDDKDGYIGYCGREIQNNKLILLCMRTTEKGRTEDVGKRIFEYSWDGVKFIVSHVRDLPQQPYPMQ